MAKTRYNVVIKSAFALKNDRATKRTRRVWRFRMNRTQVRALTEKVNNFTSNTVMFNHLKGVYGIDRANIDKVIVTRAAA